MFVFDANAPEFVFRPAIVDSSSIRTPFEAAPDAYSFFGIHPVEGGPRVLHVEEKERARKTKKEEEFQEVQKRMLGMLSKLRTNDNSRFKQKKSIGKKKLFH